MNQRRTRRGGAGRRATDPLRGLEAIRADRTTHEFRLTRLLPMRAEEFAATRSPEEIRACADAVFEGFDGTRVRSRVMSLAHRQTRECLCPETFADKLLVAA